MSTNYDDHPTSNYDHQPDYNHDCCHDHDPATNNYEYDNHHNAANYDNDSATSSALLDAAGWRRSTEWSYLRHSGPINVGEQAAERDLQQHSWHQSK